MNNLEKNLKQATGLTDRETKIYLALLELGAGSVIDVAKKAGLKRTTVYNLLPNLISAGLVRSEIIKKKKRFLIDDVRSLKNRLIEKQKRVENLIPELEAIHNILPFKPKVTYFEGEGGMKELYLDTLKNSNPGDYIYAFTGMTDFYEVFPKDFADYYIEERAKKKIRIKVVAPKSKESEKWAKTASQTLREIKLINDKDLTFKSDMEIYGNKVALVSYKENFMGVVIESKEISDMMKSVFKIMWNKL